MPERPNRFILNSDYMSWAQVTNTSVNVILPAGTTPAGSVDVITREIKLPTVKGGIPRYIISYQTTAYNMDTGQTETVTENMPSSGMAAIFSSAHYPSWLITISRKDKDTLNVVAVVQGSYNMASAVSYPSITFKLTVSYLYPPNL
jgi:hypothetical protein